MRMLVALLALASCCVAQAQAPETTEPVQSAPAATQPTDATKKDEAAAQPTATAKEQPQPAKEHANAAAETATAATDEKLRKVKVPSGYKAREKGGETVYCQPRVTLGSRFAQETCYTMAQMKELEANAATQRSELSRSGACGGPCNSAGN